MYVVVSCLCKDSKKWTCEHCDSEKADQLSSYLLKILTAASIARHPRQISLVKMNALKTDLIGALEFDKPGKGLNGCESTLQAFSEQAGNAWAMVSGVLATGDVGENASRRAAEIASVDFTAPERQAIAKAIIRHHDISYVHHCNIINCGNDCEWKLTQCPNDECDVVISSRWLRKHDETCLQKVVCCDRQCGEMMYRRLVPVHMDTSCPLKPVECPFTAVGCLCGECSAMIVV
jgi:hypothetical protein